MERLISILMYYFSKIGFYVLGAGASAPNVPMTHQLPSKVISRYYGVGLYSTQESYNNFLTRKLIGNEIDEDFILRGISDNFTDAVVMHELSKHRYNITGMPYQYLIFKKIKKPSIIFNMNHDGLAEMYCQDHIVLSPHGIIPSVYGTETFASMLDSIAIYDYSINKHNLTFLAKEESPLLYTTPYVNAEYCFPWAECLIMIGYTFGSMDDMVTFAALFGKWYHFNKIPIIIIMPNKNEEFIKTIKDAAKTNRIYFVPAYWNYLAQAIFETTYYYSDKTTFIYRIIDRYYKLIEQA